NLNHYLFPTWIFLLFIALLAFSCTSNNDETFSSDSLLIKCWTHAHEEDNADQLKIYRPCDYMDFPDSRFRGVYIFKEDGMCQYLTLAPDDAHYFELGQWEYDATSKKLVIFNSNNLILSTYDVYELETDKLILH
ncbi:MAG: hypothetical protein AAGD05_10420, partial [Bacteroidota bacterium]